MVWLCAPILLLLIAARWSQMRPKKVEPPISAEPYQLRVVEFKKLPLNAYDVSRGADTKISIKVETTGNPPKINFNNWNWENYLRVVAVKNGVARVLEDRDSDYKANRNIVRGGEGNGEVPSPSRTHITYEKISRFRLQDINVNAGAIELRSDWAFGPNVLNARPNETIIQKMARLQKDSRVLSLQTLLPLRKQGEKIAPPIVSTDPLFDVRRVEFVPASQTTDAGDVKILLHAYYRGPILEDDDELTRINLHYTTASPSGFTYGVSDGGAYVERIKGLRHLVIIDTIDTSYARETHPHLKKLIWRADISLNNAWPRRVEIPIELPVKFSSQKPKPN